MSFLTRRQVRLAPRRRRQHHATPTCLVMPDQLLVPAIEKLPEGHYLHDFLARIRATSQSSAVRYSICAACLATLEGHYPDGSSRYCGGYLENPDAESKYRTLACLCAAGEQWARGGLAQMTPELHGLLAGENVALGKVRMLSQDEQDEWNRTHRIPDEDDVSQPPTAYAGPVQLSLVGTQLAAAPRRMKETQS